MDFDASGEENLKLLAAILRPEQTIPDYVQSNGEPENVSSAAPFDRDPAPHKILGPVPKTASRRAISAWLTSRSTSFEDIKSGKALCVAAGLDPPKGLRRALKLFGFIAEQAGVAPGDIPTVEEIKLGRNEPKLLSAIAAMARMIDAEGWASVLESVGIDDVGHWHDETVNERWNGDSIARQIVSIFGKNCTILVCGTQGSGKSATVGTILRRASIPQSHALTFNTPERDLTEFDKIDIEMLRHMSHLNWPKFPITRNMPNGSQGVDQVHLKLDGSMLSFVEVPSFQRSADNYDELGGTLTQEHGRFERVVRQLQSDSPNIVLLVERLDDLDEQKLLEAAREVRRLYGDGVMKRLMVILTHGHSFPPGNMTYEVWVFDQFRKVRQTLKRVCKGLKECPAPIVIVENSSNCPQRNGVAILPDGTDFMDLFVRELRSIRRRFLEVDGLRPIPPKRWWEGYILLIGAALLITRIR